MRDVAASLHNVISENLERSVDHLGLLLFEPLGPHLLKILWDLQNPSVRGQSFGRLTFLRFATSAYHLDCHETQDGGFDAAS